VASAAPPYRHRPRDTGCIAFEGAAVMRCVGCKKRLWFFNPGLPSRFGDVHVECFYRLLDAELHRKLSVKLAEMIRSVEETKLPADRVN
jgi:hypothetical protein